MQIFWFLRWCSEWSCSRKRRLQPAATRSASTRKDLELATENSITTHGMCMQTGLDAAGDTDQPTTSTMRIQLDNDEGGDDCQTKYMFHKASGRQSGSDHTDASEPAEVPDDEHSWHPGKQRRKKETSFTQLLYQDTPRKQSSNSSKGRGCTSSNSEPDLEEWVTTYRETKRDLGIFEPLYHEGHGGSIPHIIQFSKAKTTSRVHLERENISRIDAIKAILEEQLAMVAELRKPPGSEAKSPSIAHREIKRNLSIEAISK